MNPSFTRQNQGVFEREQAEHYGNKKNNE